MLKTLGLIIKFGALTMLTQPTWKVIYPWIKAAVLNLDSVESLLQQTVGIIAAAYEADCLLFSDLELGKANSLKAYATGEAWQELENCPEVLLPPLADLPSFLHSPRTVRQFYPVSSPPWLLDQQQSPQMKQLKTGELILPIVNLSNATHSSNSTTTTDVLLQLVIQLRRSLSWSEEELGSIEVICTQLGLAYSALYWRQRLEQSRQQAALIGRIARLLNSGLSSDETVEQVVAEVGQGLECDRCMILDLRHNPAYILATWDHPEYEFAPLQHHQTDQTIWQDAIDMFLQSGASYWQIEQTEFGAEPLQTWLREMGANSVLMIPLFIQEEFFGAIALLSYHRQRTYLLDELQTLRQVADQAAIALSSVQHYQSPWYRQEPLRLQSHLLQREAVQDELTQLMNRYSLERELDQLSARTVWVVQPPFSIIICDIDYFKLVNDTYGYLVGDEVLQALAQHLQKQLRRETRSYRYGGEEFVVLLPETGLRQAVNVAERLRQTIRTTSIQTSIGAVQLTASFGIAQQLPAKDNHGWDVVHRANQALQEAKRQGRDRIKALP